MPMDEPANLTTEALAMAFRALGHPVRLDIIEFLIKHRVGNTIPTVPTMIAVELDMELATVSHHLNQMYRFHLVTRKPAGRFSFYSINRPTFLALKEFIS